MDAYATGLPKNGPVLIVTASYNGQPPDNARQFCAWLETLAPGALAGVRYGVYATAIFHRVAGVWRMVLNAAGAGCPMTSIPASVRIQLGLCEAHRAAAAG